MENSESTFSFLMVMISVIVGFGVTELLGGSARLLRSRGEAKPYWLHVVLVVGVFMALLAIWWESWGLRLMPDWNFPAVVFMLSVPVCLYLIVSLLFPDDFKDCDFREYYFKIFRSMWIIAFLTTALGTSFRPIMFGHDFIDIDNLSSLIQLLIAVVLFSTKKPKVHEILVPVFFVIVLSDQLIFRYFITQF